MIGHGCGRRRTGGRTGGPAVYFDGMSNRRRHRSRSRSSDPLESDEDGAASVSWAYDDIRRADGPAGMLRVSCLSAPPLARLEIRDAALAAELISRCARLDENRVGRRRGGSASSAGRWRRPARSSRWCLFALPFAADRLRRWCRRPSSGASAKPPKCRSRAIFGDKVCDRAAGQAAFTKLVKQLREAAGLDTDGSRPCCDRDPERLCAAGRQDLPVQRAAGEGATIPTRSQACWRTSSGISSIATTCAS